MKVGGPEHESVVQNALCLECAHFYEKTLSSCRAVLVMLKSTPFYACCQFILSEVLHF